MFDAGFQEFFLIFVVGLLVLGPKRLPHFAHSAGLWLGRARGAITKLQREINREMMLEARDEAVEEKRAAAETESASPGDE